MVKQVSRFGELIRAARLARATPTQETLAAELGVSQSLISMWEQGHVQPSPADVGRLADILKLNAIELLAAIPARPKRESKKKVETAA